MISKYKPSFVVATMIIFYLITTSSAKRNRGNRRMQKHKSFHSTPNGSKHHGGFNPDTIQEGRAKRFVVFPDELRYDFGAKDLFQNPSDSKDHTRIARNSDFMKLFFADDFKGRSRSIPVAGGYSKHGLFARKSKDKTLDHKNLPVFETSGASLQELRDTPETFDDLLENIQSNADFKSLTPDETLTDDSLTKPHTVAHPQMAKIYAFFEQLNNYYNSEAFESTKNID